MKRIRTYACNAFIILWTLTCVWGFGWLCYILSDKVISRLFVVYCKGVSWAVRHLGGIKVSFAGLENLPRDGSVILAPKHQSYVDWILLIAEFGIVAGVADHKMGGLWGMKRILRKIKFIMIDNCGGPEARQAIEDQIETALQDGRWFVIFPEGHLSRVGTHHRYRKGVWHIQEQLGMDVIPVATNLGQRWNKLSWKKFPGDATIEFLAPIAPGLEKDVFMELLQERIETRSIELLDMENLGALNPDDIGKLYENDVAKAKRLAREQSEAEATQIPTQRPLVPSRRPLVPEGPVFGTSQANAPAAQPVHFHAHDGELQA